MSTAAPYTPGRGQYAEYVGDLVEHIEEHNCRHGCTVPEPKDVAEFGPGGCCHLLAELLLERPMPEFTDTGDHIHCEARTP